MEMELLGQVSYLGHHVDPTFEPLDTKLITLVYIFLTLLGEHHPRASTKANLIKHDNLVML